MVNVYRVRALAGALRCVLGQDTTRHFIVPLFTQVYKCVPAI